MKRARHAGPVAILAFMASGCASAPPPLPPDQIPAPPPVYGSDPYQTGTANATLPVGGVLTGTGVQGGGTAMTQEQSGAWIKDAIDKKSEELAKGFTLEGEIASDKVTAATEKKFAVSGGKGACLRMIAVADPGIAKLDMYLYDGDKLLDRDIGAERRSHVRHGRAVDEPAPRHLVSDAHGDVVAHGHLEEEALALAILRDVADAEPHGILR